MNARSSSSRGHGLTCACWCTYAYVVTAVHDAIDVGFFRALAEPRRVDVIAELLRLGGSARVGDVAEGVDVDASVVSRHLKALAVAGVVTVGRRGRERWVELDVATCIGTLKRLVELLERVQAGEPCC